MANLLMLVLDEPEKIAQVVEAWEQAGVPGITTLDSVGSRQLRAHASRDDLPLIPSMRTVFASDLVHNQTLFTVIEDDSVLERAIEGARRVVGDFSQLHTGILFVVPVGRTWGVPKANARPKRRD